VEELRDEKTVQVVVALSVNQSRKGNAIERSVWSHPKPASCLERWFEGTEHDFAQLLELRLSRLIPGL
jgi:hypothetical protein